MTKLFDNFRIVEYDGIGKIFEFRKKSKSLLSNRRVLGYGICVTLVDTTDAPSPSWATNYRAGRRRLILPNTIGKIYNWIQRIYLVQWGDFCIPHSDKLEQRLLDNNLRHKVYDPKGSIMKQLIFQNCDMVEMKLIFGEKFKSYMMISNNHRSSKDTWYAKDSIIKTPPVG